MLLFFALGAAGLTYWARHSACLFLYGFLVVASFDAASQTTGYRFGKTLIFTRISPSKTLEGMAGGFGVSLLVAVSLTGLVEISVFNSLILGIGISIFAMLGDLGASWFKRKCHSKDYGKLIPGHGGVMDRIDSLLGAGFFLGILFYFDWLV
jgi:phosphatidate cytidylyltransferase